MTCACGDDCEQLQVIIQDSPVEVVFGDEELVVELVDNQVEVTICDDEITILELESQFVVLTEDEEIEILDFDDEIEVIECCVQGPPGPPGAGADAYTEVVTADKVITQMGAYLVFNTVAPTHLEITLPNPEDFPDQEVFIANTPFGFVDIVGTIDGGTGYTLPPNTFMGFRSFQLPPMFGGTWLWGSAQRAGIPFDLPEWFDLANGVTAIPQNHIVQMLPDVGLGINRPQWVAPPVGLPSSANDNDIVVYNGGSGQWEAEPLIVGKITDTYALSDMDMDATTSYFGYEDADGSWYIKEWTRATDSFQFVKGASGYATAWTNRASQTYASYESTF